MNIKMLSSYELVRGVYCVSLKFKGFQRFILCISIIWLLLDLNTDILNNEYKKPCSLIIDILFLVLLNSHNLLNHYSDPNDLKLIPNPQHCQ